MTWPDRAEFRNVAPMLGLHAVDILRGDSRHAVRRLARAPGVSATIVLSLAIGMASVIALVGVVDTLLFREPAGIRDADRVVAVGVAVAVGVEVGVDVAVGASELWRVMRGAIHRAKSSCEEPLVSTVKINLTLSPSRKDKSMLTVLYSPS